MLRMRIVEEDGEFQDRSSWRVWSSESIVWSMFFLWWARSVQSMKPGFQRPCNIGADVTLPGSWLQSLGVGESRVQLSGESSRSSRCASAQCEWQCCAVLPACIQRRTPDWPPPNRWDHRITLLLGGTEPEGHRSSGSVHRAGALGKLPKGAKAPALSRATWQPCWAAVVGRRGSRWNRDEIRRSGAWVFQPCITFCT